MAAFSLREAEAAPRVRRSASFFSFSPPLQVNLGLLLFYAPGVPVTILPLLLPRPAPEGRCRLLGAPLRRLAAPRWRPRPPGIPGPGPQAAAACTEALTLPMTSAQHQGPRFINNGRSSIFVGIVKKKEKEIPKATLH